MNLVKEKIKMSLEFCKKLKNTDKPRYKLFKEMIFLMIKKGIFYFNTNL